MAPITVGRGVGGGDDPELGRVFTEDSGGGGSGAGDVGRQVEGNGRLSIVRRPSSRAGSCGAFENEKRKFLSVTTVICEHDMISASFRIEVASLRP